MVSNAVWLALRRLQVDEKTPSDAPDAPDNPAHEARGSFNWGDV